MCLVLVEFWVAPYPLSAPDTPAFYAELANSPGDGAVLNLPMNYDRPGYLLYQTVHGRPLSVAYISRDDPRTLTERVPVLQHFRHLGPDILGDDPALVGASVLSDLGVEYVALDRYKMPGGEERAYTEALARALFHGQTPVYEDERLTVYAAPAVEDEMAYLELGPVHWQPLRAGAGDGAPGRAVGDGPACFSVRHASGDAPVVIGYSTDPGFGAVVVDKFGEPAGTLAPAPEGDTVSLAVQPTDGAADAEFCIHADAAGSVRIERIGLAMR